MSRGKIDKKGLKKPAIREAGEGSEIAFRCNDKGRSCGFAFALW